MRGKLAAVIAAAILSLAATASSADYWARNNMFAVGNPDRPGYFEVFQKATAGPSDYWCAAGEYVRWGVNQRNTTRIYVVRGIGPSLVRAGRNSVIFSFVPYDEIPQLSDAEKGYSVSISKPGYNLSAGHGTAFCQQSIRRFVQKGLF